MQSLGVPVPYTFEHGMGAEPRPQLQSYDIVSTGNMSGVNYLVQTPECVIKNNAFDFLLYLSKMMDNFYKKLEISMKKNCPVHMLEKMYFFCYQRPLHLQ